jgi:type II secretory pathway pseudopilin PulG
LKKNKIQNITIAIIGIIIIIAIIAYNYSADQTKQKGFQFGNELAQIQQDVAELQTKFYSSDIEYIKWISTGDESAKIRSDTQIQEAYEYENLGLVEFQLAKAGIVEFNEDDKFAPPDNVLKQKVIQISENMKNKCDIEFKNEMNEFDSDKIEVEMEKGSSTLDLFSY